MYHTIDRVLIPRPAEMSAGLRAVFEAAELRAEEAALVRAPVSLPALNLVQRLVLIPEYSTLVTAVKVGGLAGALSGTGPFTCVSRCVPCPLPLYTRTPPHPLQ